MKLLLGDNEFFYLLEPSITSMLYFQRKRTKKDYEFVKYVLLMIVTELSNLKWPKII